MDPKAAGVKEARANLPPPKPPAPQGKRMTQEDIIREATERIQMAQKDWSKVGSGEGLEV